MLVLSVLVLLKQKEGALIELALFRGYRSALAASADRFVIPQRLQHVEITHVEDILLTGKLDRGEAYIASWDEVATTLYINHETIIARLSRSLAQSFRQLKAEEFVMFEATVQPAVMLPATAVLIGLET